MEAVSATLERRRWRRRLLRTTTTDRYCLGGARSLQLSARSGSGVGVAVVVEWWLLRVGAGGGAGGGCDATQWTGLFIIIKFSLLFVVVRLVVSAAVACHIFIHVVDVVVVRPVVAGPRL